jgi:hypothetical protein
MASNKSSSSGFSLKNWIIKEKSMFNSIIHSMMIKGNYFLRNLVILFPFFRGLGQPMAGFPGTGLDCGGISHYFSRARGSSKCPSWGISRYPPGIEAQSLSSLPPGKKAPPSPVSSA